MTLAASDMNFQNGERIRIRVIGPKGQLADPPFWYTVTGTMSVEDVALQFTQTIQPGMFVSISDGKNSWTFQKETHGGRNSVRRTHKLPTARYRETREAGGHRVADFNTLDDLIAHSGATHLAVDKDNITNRLYVPEGKGYRELRVWMKEGFWHAQNPDRGKMIDRLPRDASPIINRSSKGKSLWKRVVGAGRVRDYEAIDRRDRVIAGPFKSYGEAKDAAGTAGAVRFVPSGKRQAPPRASEASRARAPDPMRIATVLSQKVGGSPLKPASQGGSDGFAFETYSPDYSQPVVVFVSPESGAIALSIFSDTNLRDRYDNISTFLYGPGGYTSKRVDVGDMAETIKEVWKMVDGYAASWDDGGGVEAPRARPSRKAARGVNAAMRRQTTRETDSDYTVQGLYSDGTISTERGFDDEEKVIASAKRMTRAPWFEGDYVRVITRDGELVWDSRKARA